MLVVLSYYYANHTTMMIGSAGFQVGGQECLGIDIKHANMIKVLPKAPGLFQCHPSWLTMRMWYAIM
jgi:hypothetical protein